MNRRILLLLTDLQIGGTPRVVCEVAARLNSPPAVTIHVACLSASGPMADEIRSRGVCVNALGARSAFDFPVIRRLTRLIQTEKFDTVLSFLVHANVSAAIAAHFCPGVHFFQSIQTTQPRPRWHWLAQRLASPAADKIAVPSASVATAAHDRSGIPMEKLIIIPNGVDLTPPVLSTQHSALATPPLRASVPSWLGAFPPNIVFIGRLDPIKRLPDLLQATALLQNFAHLHIYGDGPQRAALERQTQSLDLTNSVRFHGPVPNPNQALAIADLLVLPSEAEGFGLVLIEAMAARVPVIATDAPGIRDVVQHRRTGILVPVGSPAALAAAIRWILEDETQRQSLIAAAYADVRARFTWDAVIPQYRQLLRL